MSRAPNCRFLILPLLAVLAALSLSATAPPASASPGFEPLGGASIGLGASSEREPVPVLHEGRAYVGLIQVEGLRATLVINRFDPEQRAWQRVGGPLNHGVDRAAGEPRLVSAVDARSGRRVLFASWIEGDEVMIASMDEERGQVSWRRYPAGPRVSGTVLSLMAIGGRPCVVYNAAGSGRTAAVLTDDHWHATRLDPLLPAGTRARPRSRRLLQHPLCAVRVVSLDPWSNDQRGMGRGARGVRARAVACAP